METRAAFILAYSFMAMCLIVYLGTLQTEFIYLGCVPGVIIYLIGLWGYGSEQIRTQL